MEKISMAEAISFPLRLSYSQRDAAEMLLSRDDRGLPSDQQLDRLLECRDYPENLYSENFGFDESFNWFYSVLHAVNWWRALANLAFENPRFDHKDDWGQRPGFEDRRRELSRLLANVLEAYPPADQEVAVHWLDADMQETALIELMIRYRLYTRAVEALMFEVWPDINRDLVTSPKSFKDSSDSTGKPYSQYVK